MSVSGTLSLLCQFKNTKGQSLSEAVETFSLNDSADFTDGTGIDQFNILYDNVRALAAAPETLDLTSTLSDIYGTVLALNKVRGIIIRNLSLVGGEIITVSGNALLDILGGTGPSVKVQPQGTWLWLGRITGAAIVNTTQDQLTVNPGAATLTYRLILLGIK